MRPIYTANGSTVFWVTGHFSTPPENWTVRPFLQLTLPLSNDFSAAWLTFTFPQLFAVAATLKSIDYNVAMAFILNNNSSVQLRQTWAHCTLASWLPGERPLLEIILWTQQCSSGVRSERKMLVLCSAVLTHHIRFWYLWCCGCPGLQGRQRLATPHTRSLHEFLSNGLTPSRLHIVISFLTHADHVFLGLPRSLVPGSPKRVMELMHEVARCTCPYLVQTIIDPTFRCLSDILITSWLFTAGWST